MASIEFPHVPEEIPVYRSFIMEFIGSGFYVWTYYALIVDSRAPSNVFGFAIGGVTSICDLAFGPMVGGCINPIKYIGPRLVTAELSGSLIYLTAPLLGGIFAGFYFDFFVLERKEKQELIDDDEDEIVEPSNEVDENKDFGTLGNTNNNSLKKMLFTKNNSQNDHSLMEKDNEDDNSKSDDKNLEGSELQSNSSISNI